ncbi:hypothetical protein GGR57DRAFT_259658 [Xylariaceae sp. FL1272]|nr:hypothetical protein GGR57DRAFT_259658 [Xylariaceae sp. FL1272]
MLVTENVSCVFLMLTLVPIIAFIRFPQTKVGTYTRCSSRSSDMPDSSLFGRSLSEPRYCCPLDWLIFGPAMVLTNRQFPIAESTWR